MFAAAISEAKRDDVDWEEWLAKLKAYTPRHGDCSVPQRWAEDKPFGMWVRTQRANKRKLDRGEPGEGMTAARAAQLDSLGFAWELSAAAGSWEVQLAKLKAYKRRHGDCNVPRSWAEDPRLGQWVSDQRKGKRKLDRGEPAKGMTAARAPSGEAGGARLRVGAPEMMRVRACGKIHRVDPKFAS
jgi:hypothetical protein